MGLAPSGLLRGCSDGSLHLLELSSPLWIPERPQSRGVGFNEFRVYGVYGHVLPGRMLKAAIIIPASMLGRKILS